MFGKLFGRPTRTRTRSTCCTTRRRPGRPSSRRSARLLDYMLGSLPMSYHGAITKVFVLPPGRHLDRRSVLVTKFFAVSPTTRPRNVYAAGADGADGPFPYAHVHVVDRDAPVLDFSDDAEGPWAPVASPGDTLPDVAGKGVYFSVAAVVSLARDHDNLLSENWNELSRALDELVRAVYTQLQDLLLAQAGAAPVDVFCAPRPLPRLRPGALAEDGRMAAATERFLHRFGANLRVPRVRCGQGRWALWRDEAQWALQTLDRRSPFFATLLTTFLGADTKWTEHFRFASPIADAAAGVHRPPTRTVIVAADPDVAGRLTFLLTSFLPAATKSSFSPQSRHYTPPAPAFRAARQSSALSASSAARRRQAVADMSAFGSSMSSYISSVVSSPSFDSSVTTASSPLSSPAISSHDYDDFKPRDLDLDDCDFFGPWEDLARPDDDPVRDRDDVVADTDDSGAVNVEIPPRYADVRLPSMAAALQRTKNVPAIVGLLPEFHPDFRFQSVLPSADLDRQLVAALVEDADFSTVRLEPVADDAEGGYTVVARALVADAQALDVTVVAVGRRVFRSGAVDQKIFRDRVSRFDAELMGAICHVCAAPAADDARCDDDDDDDDDLCKAAVAAGCSSATLAAISRSLRAGFEGALRHRVYTTHRQVQRSQLDVKRAHAALFPTLRPSGSCSSLRDAALSPGQSFLTASLQRTVSGGSLRAPPRADTLLSGNKQVHLILDAVLGGLVDRSKAACAADSARDSLAEAILGPGLRS
ncbi:uncharacterized protein V1510DRAFT_309278 [Dipodascopsis tothii]|uniref:uncharacterized protein n=1 Tax=Dipodascopsis tothii TaxID=44089 RepID=UPI0034CF0BC6